jgi:ATP-dependent protease ClpP protease subunit
MLSLVCLSAKAKASADVEFVGGNSYTLSGPITDKSVDAAITGLSNSEVKYLVLNTPGGEVGAGYRFSAYIKTRSDITCLVHEAASMGFVIFQACSKRYVLDHSVLMQHQASVGIPPTKVANLKSLLKGLVAQLDEMDLMQAKRLGISLVQFQKLIHDDLWLFSGSEAVKIKAADKVITASCSNDLIQKIVTRADTILLMGMFPMEVEIEKSACPLILTEKVKPKEEPNDKESEEEKSDK